MDADTLSMIMAAIEAGGKTASAIEAGRAGGRVAENNAAAVQDQGALSRYQAEQLAKLGAANLTEGATRDRADRYLTDSKTRAQQVGLGDLLSNVQDVSIGGLPSYIPKVNIGGGLRPSALGPNARAAGQNLSRQALEAQMSGADIPALPDVSGIGGAAPAQTPLQQSSALDSILDTAGAAGLGLGTYEEAKTEAEKKKSQTQTPAASQVSIPTSGLFAPGAATAPTPQTAAGVSNPGQSPDLTTMQILQLLAASGSRG